MEGFALTYLFGSSGSFEKEPLLFVRLPHRRRTPYSVGISGWYTLTSCGGSSSPQRPRWLCSMTTVKCDRCRTRFATRPFSKKQGFLEPRLWACRGPL